MRTRACAWTSVVLALGMSLPAQAAGKWTRLQTENFLFVGDASERQIRQLAQHLEQFRDVMSRALPPAALVSSTPTIVFVFQTDKSFAPYRPLFEGRPVDVSGYVQAEGDANYVAVNAEFGPGALKIIFHEYAHVLIRNTAGDLPVWASEGLAGVYETFEDRNGGKSAMIGIPHAEHLLLLQNRTLLPLRELFAVDHGSPIYNEGDRRGLLYAESWALMHYLMLGNQVRAVQLREYLLRLKDGVAHDEAFQQAFGGSPDDLERELREYIRLLSFPAMRLDFPEKVSGSGAGRGEPMDDVDVSARLADLLSRLGRLDEARAQLKKLVQANPHSGRAVGTLALLELRNGEVVDALPLLERAALLDPTDGTLLRAWGGALFARSQDRAIGDAAASEMLRKARTTLNRAFELSPNDAETLMLLGRVESMVGADHARATTLLERAVSLAPHDERYRLMLADSLVRQEEYARATAVLDALARSSRPEIQETARDLLGFVAAQIGRAGVGSASTRGRGAAESSSSSSRQSSPGGGVGPEFRPVRAGERRVPGMLTTIECRSGSVVLVVEAEGETLSLTTEDLAKVAFIGYRSAAPPSVGCGAVRPASRVFATFREDDEPVRGVDGHAIAIEWLPDDFTPP